MLTRIDEDLWEARHDFYTWGMHFPGRMTVVRLPGGELWLHSVVPIDDALAAELDALGPVAHIVAPSLFHHVHVPGAVARYPEATLHGAPGLAAKRDDLSFDVALDDEPHAAWAGLLDQHVVRGVPKINEVVFFHRPTRSLIVTDLLFYICESDRWIARTVYKMLRVWQRPGQSRLWRASTKDGVAVAASARHVVAFEPARIIPCHGERVEEDAPAALEGALGWMLSQEGAA